MGLLLIGTGCTDRVEEAYRYARTAQSLLAQDDLVNAKVVIGKALQNGGDQPEILLLDAQIKVRAGDLREAFDSYRSVLVFQPTQSEALLGVAQLGLTIGEVEAAREAIATMLAIEPNQPDALLAKGIDAITLKNYGRALELGEQILAHHPDDRRGLILKARALSLLGREQEARALLDDAAQRLGNDEYIATVLMENARDAGDAGRMLEQLPLLRASRPDSIDLALDETNIRYKTGDVDGARATSLEILRNFGGDAMTMQRLVDLWREYDPDPLAADAQAWIAQRGQTNARIAAARYYLERGMANAADRMVAASSDARAVALRARIAVRQGREGSIRAVANILSQDTTSCDALAAAAEWNLTAGKPVEAVRTAQQVATQCPDLDDGYSLLARAYREQGRDSGVQRAFSEGASVHPGNLRLARDYAEWLLEDGQDGKAASVARKLTDVAPSKVSSWQLLIDVCGRTGDRACVARAQKGRALARTDFTIDFQGPRAANPLLGRQWQ